MTRKGNKKKGPSEQQPASSDGQRASRPPQPAAVPSQAASPLAGDPPPGNIWAQRSQPAHPTQSQQFPAMGAFPPQAAQMYMPGPPMQRPPRQQPPPMQQARPAPPRAAPAPVTREEQVLEQLVHMKPFKEEVVHRTLPSKPTKGTLGREIALLANHYPVELGLGYVYHYDVEIESLRTLKPGEAPDPKELQTKAKPQQVTNKRVPATLAREVLDKLQASAPNVFARYLLAYDGNKNIYTRKPLLQESTNFLVTYREEGRDVDSRFKVTIKPVSKDGTNDCVVNLEPIRDLYHSQRRTPDYLEAVTALDIIMRSGPSKKLFPVRSSFFNIPRNPRDKAVISGGHEIWFGYYQSLRPGQWKPMLNIDKSATTFYPAGPVLDFITNFLRRSLDDIVRLSEFDLKKLNKEMRNVQIQVTHLAYPRKYRVGRVTAQRASDIMFQLDSKDKKQISVNDYFRMKYKAPKYPHFPCLQMMPLDKKIYVPVEFCLLTQAQHYKRKLTELQTADMIKFTAVQPQERFKAIQESLNSMVDCSQHYLKEFDIQVSRQPAKVTGRVLNAPDVVYDQNAKVQPREGAWNIARNRFLRGSKVERWAILCLADDRSCQMGVVKNLSDMLISNGRKLGVEMAQPLAIVNKSREASRGSNKVLNEIYNQFPKLDLLVVILGKGSNYAEIKTTAEVQLGLMTQCLKEFSVTRKCNEQLIVNVLQKINAKMGGVNNALIMGDLPPIMHKPVLILGADVSHPAPGENSMPSISALVGNLDAYPTRFGCVIKVQKYQREVLSRVEKILCLKEMVVSMLKKFYVATRKKPEKIIMYRDGVSEGQFADVLEGEVPQIRDACKTLQADYQPGITFVVVQKRHHTRFIPEDYRQGVGRGKNVPPGTMVDTTVCTPTDFDFFLCSHTGIQGTSRPAHYTVIWDDNNFNSNDMHKLTYHLCHTYVRCTRSISIPAPVMYAHLVAFRARHYITTKCGSDDSSYETHSSNSELQDEIIKAVEVTDFIKEKMYFV